MTDSPSRKPKDAATHIGNHKLDPATLMMGYGFDPALSEGSLKPPIFLTSTFVFEKAADGKHVFEGITGKRPGGGMEGLVYSRFNGPNQEILEDRLALWEDAEEALTFSSGMTAITTLFLTFVRPGDVIVHSGPLYAATESVIAKILSQFGVHYVDFPAGSTREEIDAAIEAGKANGRVAMIYLESPANPTNALVDVEAVHAARAAAFDADKLPPIAIDNTFLGPLWAKPQDQGADISVYSLTKYAGGHSEPVPGRLNGQKAPPTPVPAQSHPLIKCSGNIHEVSSGGVCPMAPFAGPAVAPRPSPSRPMLSAEHFPSLSTFRPSPLHHMFPLATSAAYGEVRRRSGPNPLR